MIWLWMHPTKYHSIIIPFCIWNVKISEIRLLLGGYFVMLFMRICKTRLYLRIVSRPFHIELDALLTLALEFGIYAEFWDRATLISGLVYIYSNIYRLWMRIFHSTTILMMYWNDVNTHMNIVSCTTMFIYENLNSSKSHTYITNHVIVGRQQQTIHGKCCNLQLSRFT